MKLAGDLMDGVESKDLHPAPPLDSVMLLWQTSEKHWTDYHESPHESTLTSFTLLISDFSEVLDNFHSSNTESAVTSKNTKMMQT